MELGTLGLSPGSLFWYPLQEILMLDVRMLEDQMKNHMTWDTEVTPAGIFGGITAESTLQTNPINYWQQELGELV